MLNNYKLKNLKILKLVYRASASAVLVCFLTFFLGAIDNTKIVTVKDSSGLDQQLALTKDHEQNMQELRSKGLINDKDTIHITEVDDNMLYSVERAVAVEEVEINSRKMIAGLGKIGVNETLKQYLQNRLKIELSESDIILLNIESSQGDNLNNIESGRQGNFNNSESKQSSGSSNDLHENEWIRFNYDRSVSDLIEDFKLENNGCLKLKIKVIEKAVEVSSVLYGGDLINGKDLIKSSISSELKLDFLGFNESISQFLKRTRNLELNSYDEVSVLQAPERGWLKIDSNEIISVAGEKAGLNVNDLIYKPIQIKIDHYILQEFDELVAFKTHKKESSKLKPNERRFVTKGESGLNKVVFKNKIEHNEVVDRKEVSRQVVKQPVDEILEVGVSRSFIGGMPSVPRIYRRGRSGESGVLTGFATNYNTGSTTSTGTRPTIGTVAADPSKIPYGAIVEVYNKAGKQIYSGVMADYCGASVKGGAVVDLYGVNIGKVPVTVKWHVP